ncbi:MAG: hypothetical protein KatS3mg035_0953 [Bacteroidia bacterium]|nr:MAG: hypothetical protein KatS3mg035_0953 [Bacteroidia bacterium]
MYNFEEIIKIIDRPSSIELDLKDYIQQNKIELTNDDLEILNNLQEYIESYHPKPIIAKTDLQGNILYVNNEFLKVSGYSREEIIGQNIRILKSGNMEHGAYHYQELWQKITQKKFWHGQLKNLTKNFDSYWVDTYIAPIFDAKGEVEGYWSIGFNISKQKELEEKLNEKKKDIEESLRYARRIQKVILPSKKVMEEAFGADHYFVINQAKDVVSGDFYWFNQVVDKIFVAVVDCTGHGVPGAFMSLIGYNLLNQIVIQKGIHQPGKILTELHKEIRATLKQDIVIEDSYSSKTPNRDGMDVCLVAIHKYDESFEYAGANRPLFIVRNQEIIEIKPTKSSIGGEQMEEERIFENHEIEYQPNDIIYMFSDGIVDQFGGPDSKKFSTKRLKEVIIRTLSEKMATQRALFNMEWKEWKDEGEVREYTDDVTMIGIRLGGD